MYSMSERVVQTEQTQSKRRGRERPDFCVRRPTSDNTVRVQYDEHRRLLFFSLVREIESNGRHVVETILDHYCILRSTHGFLSHLGSHVQEQPRTVTPALILSVLTVFCRIFVPHILSIRVLWPKLSTRTSSRLPLFNHRPTRGAQRQRHSAVLRCAALLVTGTLCLHLPAFQLSPVLSSIRVKSIRTTSPTTSSKWTALSMDQSPTPPTPSTPPPTAPQHRTLFPPRTSPRP